MTLQAILNRAYDRHVTLMQKTLDTLGNILQHETDERLTTLTDGPDGWTVTEVLCHLRDFDDIFYQRVLRIVNEDKPQLVPYDHEAMARERNYRAQYPIQVYAELQQSRQRFIDYFKSLSPEHRTRMGIHPQNGEWTVMDALMQVGHHDANHIEQITRILTQ
jgi:hypothetical protein